MNARKGLFIVVCLTLCVPVFSQDRTMQLLDPMSGWVLDNGHLFWTIDRGAHWDDISPDLSKPPGAVFFLDTKHAWALTTENEKGLMMFGIASTTDAGRGWSKAAVKVPSQTAGELDGTGWLDFVDSMHGWLLLRANSSSAFSWGLLLATEDGGMNWRELPHAPIAARPVFVTPKDGWISGIAGGGGTYRTRDGGKTWEAAGPTDPATGVGVDGGVYFVDARHGYISGVFTRPHGVELVQYVTEDGGDTWKLDRSLADRSSDSKSGAPLNRFGPASMVPTSIGSTLLTTINDGHGRLSLEVIGRDSKAAVSTSEGFLDEREGTAELSFVSSSYGWLRTDRGRILATDNSGSSWTDISPVARRRSSGRESRELSQPTVIGPGPLAVRQSSAAGVYYSRRLGFDAHNVPSIAAMNTWFVSVQCLQSRVT